MTEELFVKEKESAGPTLENEGNGEPNNASANFGWPSGLQSWVIGPGLAALKGGHNYERSIQQT